MKVSSDDKYPEIESLRSYFKKFTIEITACDNSSRDDFRLVELVIDSNSWKIYIDDEYGDFSSDNPLMCLFLVFNSLEIYSESEDYLAWSRLNNLNASDMNWLSYFKSLDTIYREIENRIGKIDPCISSYDYNLRTGIIESLASIKFIK